MCLSSYCRGRVARAYYFFPSSLVQFNFRLTVFHVEITVFCRLQFGQMNSTWNLLYFLFRKRNFMRRIRFSVVFGLKNLIHVQNIFLCRLWLRQTEFHVRITNPVPAIWPCLSAICLHAVPKFNSQLYRLSVSD